MGPAFMATMELVYSGRPNADGGQRIPSPSSNKRQLRAAFNDTFVTCPIRLESSPRALCLSEINVLKGNDGSCSVFSRSAIYCWDHILVRGRADDGSDLVISRDYIGSGLRARAGDLVTRELGPRSELEVRRGLEAEVNAERWTRLDRSLAREAGRAEGVVDLRPERDAGADPLREVRIGRMRTLERLGLAEPAGPARWILAPDAEQRLRSLGERGDIIKRLHKTLTKDGVSRAPSSWALEGESHGEPIIGRLIARGLDDELRGTAFAVVDGIDGRVHHLKLPDIEWPVMGRSAVLWSYVVSTMQEAGSASRWRSARISISTSRWQRKGRPGSTGGWSPRSCRAFARRFRRRGPRCA